MNRPGLRLFTAVIVPAVLLIVAVGLLSLAAPDAVAKDASLASAAEVAPPARVSSTALEPASALQQKSVVGKMASAVVPSDPGVAGEQAASSATAADPAPAFQQDDLAGEIISIVVAPTPAVAGEQATFTVTVRNTGTNTWDPTGVEAEVIVVDEDGTELANGWGSDAVPFEVVAPGAETSVIAYLQVPLGLQGIYRYTVKLWYLSTLMDSYTAEDVLLEVSPAEGLIEAYEDDANRREESPLGVRGGGGQAVDLVFAMDTSGSMSDEFSTLCSKIDDVVIDLQSRGITVRHKILGINANRECTTNYVSNLIPLARSNHVEDWAPATYDLSHGYGWATGYVRMIIPMSDEGPENGNPCYDPGEDRDAISDAIAAAQANDVRVSPVLGSWYQSSQAACITQLAEDLANGTGGRVFYSTDPSTDLAAGIAALVAGAVPPSLRGDGTPPSEGPRYTVADLARESAWSDEVFYGWILPESPTEQDLQRNYHFGGVITLTIPISRYYGATIDPSNPSPLSPELRGKAVPDTIKLTIMAYDVDEYVRNPFAYAPDTLPPHEEDWIYVNGQPIDSYFVGQPHPEMLSGRNEEWVSHDYDVPVELLNFPARSPSEGLKVANNTITIEVDYLDQGYATAVAWARLRIPGLRPTILVRGFDVGNYITPLGFLPVAGSHFIYWSDWFNYLGSGPPAGWLVREGFPNAVVPIGSHIDPENSDVLVSVEGIELYSENGPVIRDKVRDILDGYGVDKVNLVGHSKGGIDIREALGREIGGGRSGKLGKYVDTVVTLGSPHEGIPVDIIRLLPFDAAKELTYGGMDQFNSQHYDLSNGRFVSLIGNQQDAWYYQVLRFASFFRAEQSDSFIEIKSATGCRREGLSPDYYRTGFIRTNFEVNHSEEVPSESMFNEALRYLKPPALGGERQRQPDQPSSCGSAQMALHLKQSNSTAVPQHVAMITGTIASGAVHTHTLALEGESASVSLIWPYADTMGLTLIDPDGVPLDPTALPGTITYTQSLTDTKYANYFIQAPQPGWWTAEITVTNPYTGGEPYMLVADAVSPLVLETSISQTLYSPGDTIVVTAVISDTGQPVTGATVRATMTVSETLVTTLDLLDDGQHNDSEADDGVYGGVLTDTTHSGSYFFEVRAAGVSGGTPFTRLGYAQTTVASGAARLLSYAEVAMDSDGDGLYNTLAITANVETYATGQYQVVGQLTNQSSTIIVSASAFISGTAGTYPAVLSFDGQIIAQSGLDGPYQLRELYLIDRNMPTPVQADYQALAYTTAAYSASQFQRDSIILSSPVTDTGVDNNGNGLYELLRVNAPLDVRHAGIYTVTVTLADGNDQSVTGFTRPYTLTAGLNTLALDFNGPSINLYNVDGTYQVKSFLISRIPTETLEVTDLHTTQPYSYTAFEADTVAPSSAIDPLPGVITTTPVINVTWSGSDPELSSGIAFYDVQYKVGSTGTWTDWLTQTVLTRYPFGPSDPITVTSGETYYFQVRAIDYADNQEAYPGGDGDAHTTMLGVDLQAAKSASTDFIQEHTADYSINYRNDGPVAAHDVVLTDTLPSGLSYVADTSGITPTVSGNAVMWSLGTVPAFANRSFNLTTYVTPTLVGGTLITNTLDISTPDQESDYSNNSAVASTTVVTATSDMYVEKWLDYGTPVPGGDIQYQIRYQNDGNSDAPSVIITDTLPVSTTYVSDYNSAGFTTVITGSTVAWTKPYVSSGESGYLYLTVHISDTLSGGETLTNTVQASTNRPETNYANNVYTDTRTVQPRTRNMRVTKSLYSGTLAPGNEGEYRIYYQNQGNTSASNIAITDTLPANTTYISDRNTAGFTTVITGSTVVWSKPAVEAGESGNLYLRARILETATPGDVLTNVVEISTSDVEIDPGDNVYTYTHTVQEPTWDMYVSKSLSGGNTTPGNNLTYRIYYRNYGNSSAGNVVITDTLPVSTTYLSFSGPYTPTVSGNQVIWNLGSVSGSGYSGSEGNLYVTVHLSETVPVGTVLTNTVEIATSVTETNYANNTYLDSRTVYAGFPDLRLYKYFESGDAPQGSEVTYRLYYYNYNYDAAIGVTITDTLPMSVTYVSATGAPEPTIDRDQVVWHLPFIPGRNQPGYQGNIYLTAFIPESVAVGTVLTNTAVITTPNDANLANNSASDVRTVVAGWRDLLVEKWLESGNGVVGSDVTYGIHYRNLGNASAADVIITDTLPVSTTYVSHSGAFTPTVVGNNVIWDPGTVPGQYTSGYEGYLYVTVHIAEGTPPDTVLTNTVSIATSQAETDYSNNTDEFPLQVFSRTADILFVPDYGGDDTDWFQPYFTDALDKLGYSYDVWDTAYRGGVYSDTLYLYTDGVVIWAVPEWGYLFDSDVQTDIEAYLDAGGRLFITGQDVAYGTDGSSFLSDYLHASYVQDDPGLRSLQGTAGDPIGDGLTLGISGGEGADNQWYPDEVDPISPAVTIFTYDTVAGTGLTESVGPEATMLEQKNRGPGAIPGLGRGDGAEKPHREPAGGNRTVSPTGVISSGTGGLRVDTGTYKVVYFAFGFEGINSQADRNTVMERLLAWLWGVLPRPMHLNPANGSAVAEGDVAFAWTSVAGISEYQIQIDTVDTFNSPALISDTVTNASYTTTLTLGTWYWRVRALPDGAWTAPWEVRVAEPLEPLVQVTTHPEDDWQPAITRTDDGKLRVVWHSWRDGNSDIWYKTSDDNGGTWSGDTQLTTNPNWDYDPAITQAGDGTIWVVWYSYRSGNADIWYKTSSDGGATWSAAIQLTSDLSSDYSPAIAQTSDGTIWVVWYSYRAGNADIWYKTSDDGGATWSSDVQLTTVPEGDYRPAITQTNDGKIWLLWDSWRSDHPGIWYKTSNDDGASWSSDAEFSTDTNWDVAPTIGQTSDGTIWVARQSWSGDLWNWDIWYRTSSDGGSTWSVDQKFTQFTGDDLDPVLATLPSDQVALVWSSDRAVNYDVWFGIIGVHGDVNPPPHLDWVENDPWPNPDSNDITTVRAQVSDETGVSSVTLKWVRDGTPQPDLTMYDDGAHDDYGPDDGWYGVQIGSFPVGTVVEYQIEITDVDGNTILAPQSPVRFESLEPFVKTANILFVPDYGGYDTDWFRNYYEDALGALGYQYDVWDTGRRGEIDSVTLNQYTNGAVIWAVPYWGFITDYDSTHNTLQSFLDNGGNLFVTGQNIGPYIGGTSFYQDYLHANYVQDNVGLTGLTGVPGDPIGSGLDFSITGGEGADDQYSPDEIDPVSPAVSVLTYSGSIAAALQRKHVPQRMEEQQPLPRPNGAVPGRTLRGGRRAEFATPATPQSCASTCSGGIRVDTGTYKVLYFAFGFEGINSRLDRRTVMGQVLNWFGMTPPADVIQVTTHFEDDWQPAITRTSDGKLWVVWHSWRDGNNDIWYKTSDDNGATWSADTQLTTDPSSDYDPAIMQAGDGTIWAVWYSYRSGNADLWNKTSTDGGATWSAAAQLTNDPSWDGSPVITQANDGKIWVVWESGRSGNEDIWYKTSSDGGATWSAATQLTTDSASDWWPGIIQASDGNIWVVWESNRSGNADIWYQTSADGGATWSAATQLTTSGDWDYWPAITQTTDGKIWVAWSIIRNGNRDIWYKTNTDGGTTWSAKQRFTQFTGTDDAVMVTPVAGNKVALVWQSDRAVNFDIWFGIIGVHGDVNPPPHLDFVRNDPWPNPDSSDTTTIRARVSDETGVISVTLKWVRDGTPQPDLTMYDDGAHDDYGPDDGWYGVQIGSFPVGTIVEYQIEITDVDSNTILAPQYPTRFESLEPFVKTANVLFVPDNRGYDTGWFMSYYEDALGALGYRYDVWDTGRRGEIDSITLNQYTNGAVVWAVPYWGFITDYDSTRNTLQSFLDNGGNLFVTGQNIGAGAGWTSFYQDYLHASHVQDNVGLTSLTGAPSDPIGSGLGFSIVGGDGANDQYSPDEIDPIAPATTIFTYDADAAQSSKPLRAPAARHHRGLKGRSNQLVVPPRATGGERPARSGLALPNQLPMRGRMPELVQAPTELQGAIGSGSGAIRVHMGTYKVVYFAFGFEGVSSELDRKVLMERVLRWLGVAPDCPLADFDCNCVVDAMDLQQVASRWRAKEGGPQYSAAYDLDNDRDIDIIDIMIVVARWGVSCPASPESQFVGSWVNENPDTGGITLVEIRTDASTIFVHMWGACEPTDCDWGEETTDISDADDGVISLTWTFAFAIDTQELTVLSDGRLQVVGYTHFTDGSGRPDYDYTEYFVGP